MAGAGARAAADDVDRAVEDDGPRVVASRRQLTHMAPCLRAAGEAEDVAERARGRLRLAAEERDRTAVGGRAGGAARRDRRPCAHRSCAASETSTSPKRSTAVVPLLPPRTEIALRVATTACRGARLVQRRRGVPAAEGERSERCDHRRSWQGRPAPPTPALDT